MQNNLSDALFVFTTSPAGLGHIRVIDAIKDGKPSLITSVDLGVLDIHANRIHDLGSRIWFFRKLTEFYQTNKIAETIVTAFYSLYLMRHTSQIKKDFMGIAKEYPKFKKWVVVSTHFALAHSISSAKKELERELGIKIYLCVVVTDDSPQKIWAVKESDITFVPSTYTKDRLQMFFPPEKRESVKAISFPIAPRLSYGLSTEEFQFVTNQLDPKQNTAPQIEIPISGAAVQMDFFQKFIETLCRENYSFTVIGQESLLTGMFFDTIRKLPRIQISVGTSSWQTVSFYESTLYQPNRPSIEITKPSEQSFKAILSPRQRGGLILLLTKPIGRQEYDNLNFLTRNGLIPTKGENDQIINAENITNWLEKAKTWRGIRLPGDPIKAANFVKKLKASGFLYNMLYTVIPEKDELKDTGVAKIWEEIGKMI